MLSIIFKVIYKHILLFTFDRCGCRLVDSSSRQPHQKSTCLPAVSSAYLSHRLFSVSKTAPAEHTYLASVCECLKTLSLPLSSVQGKTRNGFVSLSGLSQKDVLQSVHSDCSIALFLSISRQRRGQSTRLRMLIYILALCFKYCALIYDVSFVIFDCLLTYLS